MIEGVPVTHADAIGSYRVEIYLRCPRANIALQVEAAPDATGRLSWLSDSLPGFVGEAVSLFLVVLDPIDRRGSAIELEAAAL